MNQNHPAIIFGKFIDDYCPRVITDAHMIGIWPAKLRKGIIDDNQINENELILLSRFVEPRYVSDFIRLGRDAIAAPRLKWQDVITRDDLKIFVVNFSEDWMNDIIELSPEQIERIRDVILTKEPSTEIVKEDRKVNI
jgi:hypothetical protein